MNKLARLSAAERKQIIDDFITEMFTGLGAEPKLKEKLQLTAPELPEEPSPEQVGAWVELAELVQDPGFRQRMRKMAEYHLSGNAAHDQAPNAGTPEGFTQKLTELVGQARERDIAPDSPEAAEVVARLLEGADASRRAYVRKRLEAGLDSQSDRYHELLAVINGQQARPSRVPDLEWLIAAIDSHLA